MADISFPVKESSVPRGAGLSGGLAGGLHAPRGLYRKGVKRALDLTLCLLVLLPAMGVIAVLALLVRLDGSPAFFAHERVGRGGRRFRCWKLRSMVPDAPQRLLALLASDPALRAEWDATCKLQNDPRVTRLGRMLRRTSLDELPQLLNVLSGEMSLVGPRPVTAPELTRYGADRLVYLSLRPGLTGLWQVTGRGAVSYPERVALDMRYARGLSLWGDLTILWRTLFRVLGRSGS